MKNHELLAILFLLLPIGLTAQVSLSCAGSSPSTMTPPANPLVCGTTTIVSTNSNNPPVVEYIITNPNVIADDYIDDDNDPATAPVAQMLGPAIIGTSTTTSINPTNYGLQPGDQFRVTAVNYDLGQIQNLIDDLYNNRFLFVPCCTVVQAVVPDLCADLMAAGISQGSDIQNLNDMLLVFDQFNPVPGSTNSIAGFIGQINVLNGNASQVPGPCGGNLLPICYAIDQGNVADYDYRPVPVINNITDNCPTSTDQIIVDASISSGVLEYSLDGASWQSSNTLTANLATETVYVREATCGEQVTQLYTIPCLSPLAVELDLFEGFATEEGNVLRWQTANEWQNDYFDLEKSLDGNRFETIGQIPSQGSSAASQSYRFVDMDKSSGLTYYRLKMIDLMGQMEHSHIISLERKDALGPASLQLSPNPAKDFLQLAFHSSANSDARISLYSHEGRLIRQEQLQGTRDLQTITWDVADLAPGLYWVRLQDGKKQQLARFVKN
ncbi:MAG: T9SS type A sorting domain-containing protein [Bacteroidota bacterium]